MDRLSPLDAAFLYSEDGASHNDIGMVLQFEGPAPARAELMEAVAARLPRLPRYRQKLRFLPMDVALPVWVDDPDFDLSRHVLEGPAATGPDALAVGVGRVMSAQLARTKPLWEMHVLRGLPEDGWALVVRMHHCMVDGVTSAEIIGTLLTPAPKDPALRIADTWRPAPAPSDTELLAAAASDSARAVVAGLRAAASEIPGAARALANGAGALEAARPPGLPVIDPMFNGPVGPERRFAQIDVPLADLKAARHALGGTVNDVMLTVCAAGFRALLHGRGVPVDGRVLRTLVPVSLRRDGGSKDDAGTGGNEIGAMVVELPLGAGSVGDHLTVIARQTASFKRLKDALPAADLRALPGFAPPVLLTLGSRVAATAPSFVQTVTSNVPGPPGPLHLCGRPLRRLSACIALWAPLRIAVSMLSFGDTASLGLVADRRSVADLPVLYDGMRQALVELRAAADRPRPS